MEMEFKDPSARRRRLLIIVGLATAVLAGLTAYQMSAGGSAAAPPVAKQTVVVATREIPARTVLQLGDVAMREVVQDASVETAAREPEAVIGRMTAVTLLPGQVVYPNLLVTTSEGAGFGVLGPGETIDDTTPHWRAVSVMVPRERAVGGQILTGQHVDLIVTVGIEVLVPDENGVYQTVPASGDLMSGDSTKITYQDLEVLEASENDSMYILKVDLHQAEEISHIARVAPNSFSLVLRADGDGRQVLPYEYGVTTDRLIMKYLYPVPLVLDLTQLPGSGELGPPPPVPTQAPSAPAPQPSPEPEPSAQP